MTGSVTLPFHLCLHCTKDVSPSSTGWVPLSTTFYSYCIKSLIISYLNISWRSRHLLSPKSLPLIVLYVLSLFEKPSRHSNRTRNRFQSWSSPRLHFSLTMRKSPNGLDKNVSNREIKLTLSSTHSLFQFLHPTPFSWMVQG